MKYSIIVIRILEELIAFRTNTFHQTKFQTYMKKLKTNEVQFYCCKKQLKLTKSMFFIC